MSFLEKSMKILRVWGDKKGVFLYQIAILSRFGKKVGATVFCCKTKKKPRYGGASKVKGLVNSIYAQSF